MVHGRGKLFNEKGELEFDGYFYEGEAKTSFKQSTSNGTESNTTNDLNHVIIPVAKIVDSIYQNKND